MIESSIWGPTCYNLIPKLSSLLVNHKELDGRCVFLHFATSFEIESLII